MDPQIDPNLPRATRLLLAAEYVIARDGVNGASLRNAAKLVGASRSLYMYYFGHEGHLGQKPPSTKAGVIEAVIQMRLETIRSSGLQFIRSLEARYGTAIHSEDGDVISLLPGLDPDMVTPEDIALAILIPGADVLLHDPSSAWCRFTLALYLAEPETVWGSEEIQFDIYHQFIVDLISLKVGGPSSDATALATEVIGQIIFSLAIIERECRNKSVTEEELARTFSLIMLQTKARIDSDFARPMKGNCLKQARSAVSQFKYFVRSSL